MRPSPFRHTLAVLRTAIGLTQKEMATLAECSTPTIQAIELGKLRLSDKLGQLIARNTGASLTWLMADDTTRPAVNEEGNPIDKGTFEAFRATALFDQHPDFKLFQIMNLGGIYEHRLKAALLRGFKANSLSLCAYRLSKFFDDLEKAIGVTEEDHKDLTDSARAMRSASHRKAGTDIAKLHVPLLTPYHATLHAIAHRDAKGNEEQRRAVWDRLQKATKGFHVHGERKLDGRTVWMVERDTRGPNAATESEGRTATPDTVAGQPPKIIKVSPGKGPAQK
jgi:transcriptional regulator with XRE-family HTH domain